MQHFSGFEYLLIDAANQKGMDKELFETRIKWAENNIGTLESFAEIAEEPALFTKAVSAIRKAQAGEPTGHRVGLDACNSGMQIMSVLTGCPVGAEATGLIDPTVRADAYGVVTDRMNAILVNEGLSVSISRSDAKDACMTAFYGSRAEPKKLFGIDTPELASFYLGIQQTAPGAWELLQDLLGSWQPFALLHEWVLPDGFVARVKVMEKIDKRIEVDELDHATFSYEWYENNGSESGLSNVANTIHSVDAYLQRSLIRRCSYDQAQTQDAIHCCFTELLQRDLYEITREVEPAEPETIKKYRERFEATNMVDAVIIPYLDPFTVRFLSIDHLRRLNQMMEEMLDHKPFPLVCVHDEFTAHANNINVLRQQYINLMAELADSTVLDDIFQSLTGAVGTYTKLSSDLAHKVRGSNYALS
jgi:hypothetical protein